MQKLFQVVIICCITAFLFSGCEASRESQVPPVATIETLPSVAHSNTPTLTATLPLPSPSLKPTETNIPVTPAKTVIAFTGVIVPARCVQEEIDRQGSANYIYSGVKEILSGADITVGVYNATMRDDVPYMGCVKSWELIGSSNNADALAQAGFDVMSVATNHIKDCGFLYCGSEGFFSTIEHFDRVNIQTVGGGENLSEALEPVVVEVNGIRFGFVSLGGVNEKVFADYQNPGIAFLSDRNLETAINRAKKIADVVIVLPHSGPEDYPEVTPQQYYWARHSVEYGADLVVMTHAHILQGHQTIGDVPVFYSLGNFVFDQSWARDHQQAAILLVEFNGDQVSSFEFIPTIVEQDGTVYLPGDAEREEILTRLEELSAELSSDN